MARARSPKKRSAILLAAVEEIARVGLGAATAKIAKRAGVASGTLFLYFENKEELLNDLYVELKSEVYARINVNWRAFSDFRTLIHRSIKHEVLMRYHEPYSSNHRHASVQGANGAFGGGLRRCFVCADISGAGGDRSKLRRTA
jgi:AcrR family transcriptional regulator